MTPDSQFRVGMQPCVDFVSRDELADRGVRGNRHSCYGPYPVDSRVERCGLLTSFCESCVSDHHQDGWDTCRPAGSS